MIVRVFTLRVTSRSADIAFTPLFFVVLRVLRGQLLFSGQQAKLPRMAGFLPQPNLELLHTLAG